MVAVAALPASGAIEYPASDGEPMAETDIHRDEMADTIDTLKDRYAAEKDVYVAGNLLIYYEEGNPAARFAPDVFVVRGVPKRRRRIYKLWQEERPPEFVLEVTSRGTRLEDKGSKKALCAELEVAEYFLYDPEADYLKPPLQGYRLVQGHYARIPPAGDGSVQSEVLGLRLMIEKGRLRLFDPTTGARLLRPDEARRDGRQAHALARREGKRAQREVKRAQLEASRAQAAEERAQLEASRAQAAEERAQLEASRAHAAEERAQLEASRAHAAEDRVAAAEAELLRLRALLAKQG